ncbi:unnamed protein product, partial [Mesorhabditis belari]|uniref:Uncharacterized protein n=1 Tax=Mesorhabditis belari TaxID=2138241 RepID=A0AAF3FBN5_9BILA
MALLNVSDSWIIISATSKLFFLQRKGKDLETTSHKIIDVTEVSTSLPFVRTTYELEENVRTNQGEKIEMCCSAISRDGQLFAVAISSKICLIYSLSSSIEMKRAFRVPKAPSVITFDPQGEHLKMKRKVL